MAFLLPEVGMNCKVGHKIAAVESSISEVGLVDAIYIPTLIKVCQTEERTYAEHHSDNVSGSTLF